MQAAIDSPEPQPSSKKRKVKDSPEPQPSSDEDNPEPQPSSDEDNPEPQPSSSKKGKGTKVRTQPNLFGYETLNTNIYFCWPYRPRTQCIISRVFVYRQLMIREN